MVLPQSCPTTTWPSLATGCAVALSVTLGTLRVAGAQELRCEHNSLPIDLDLKDGMMFVRDSVWLGQVHPEMLPAGVRDTKEEGNHVTAEFKIYPRNKIGAGTYEVQFKFDFWKRESYVWVDVKAGYDTYHELFYCRPRPKPVVEAPAPVTTIPVKPGQTDAYLWRPAVVAHSVCIFNASGWWDCVTNVGDRYQLKPVSIRWFVNIANGAAP
jgi:hypothetical protein